ncbi:hypothetical protein EIP86_002478 [Pleurotus ostreatoroseus]|nr:hypothetical protein EIP86_002478 [Pleurotus ostreatoroseus]
MDFLRRLTHSVLDGISTPPAPKIGRIPLPDVDSMHDVKDIVVQLEGHRSASDDCSSGCSSPVSPITQKRKWSFSASRSSTPQTRCTSRTSSSSYPHPASTLATPHIVAPTPRRVGEMLREDGWRHCESPAQDEQTEVTSQHTDRAKRTSSNPAKPSRTVTPHSPSVDLVHSPQGAARPRSNSTRDERHAHRELDHRRHHGLVVSRPSTATSSVGHLSERALPLERSGTPGHTTKRPPKGILKSTPKLTPTEPAYLHWQLLPYDPTKCKKKLLFDVALRVAAIRDHTRMPPLAIGSTDLDKPAVNLFTTEMIIRCRQLPQWDIVARNPSGVTCGDVFHAIHNTLCTPLTDREQHKYVTDESRERVLEAFDKRCRDTPELDEYTRQRGMMRVDLLQGKRIFIGLSCPPGSDVWTLDLGHPHRRT